MRYWILRVATLVLVASCSSGPWIGSRYGDPQRKYFHDAVDIGARLGDPVLASADGFVAVIENDGFIGMEVRIVHDRIEADLRSKGAHLVTGYLHLRRVTVGRGERVSRGQVIGEVGLFAASNYIPHVHWRVCTSQGCWPGDTLDPLTLTSGCFKSGKTYSNEKLSLTYPIKCR
ncbi:MAG: M23 family metallopeptidase [Deltaproteobacteria bacterium]|nr:M23 family metallopeptidase [Deltaproteobacteria bacterium]